MLEKQHIVWFKQVSKDDVNIVGGKGANLGEMSHAALPIPPGFVITAGCYKDFIERTNIKYKILNLVNSIKVSDTDQLEAIALKIQKLITSTEIPKDIAEEILEYYTSLSATDAGSTEELLSSDRPLFVAIRSSATAEDLAEASFAGQQASFLNVKGNEQVIKAVRDCWASLYTGRAIYYRVRNNFDHSKVFIAVVVQKMVDSRASGVMFTVNPATNDDSEIVIEAVRGLGEAIVSGSVNPDLYIVNKERNQIIHEEVRGQDWQYLRDRKTGKTIKKDISDEEKKKRVLNDKEVLEIARLGRRIHAHYNKPQDIEWAIEGANVYIVQSRPVTTFKQTGSEQKENSENIEEEVKSGKIKILVSGLTASPGVASGIVKIVHDISELNKIQQGDILVTPMTNPDMVPGMQKAVAIVADLGGLTCHAAIVSREMGKPCIVGTEHATKVLKEGQMITVDAIHGHVYDGAITIETVAPPKPMSLAAFPLETATKIKVLCDLPEIAEKAAATGADGVGLIRIEFMIVAGGVHPSKFIRDGKEQDYVALLVNGIKTIADKFKNKPVWVRTSDIRTDEYRALKGGSEEPNDQNPMIGWHGIRRALDEPGILKAEFKAIKKLHELGYKNVGVMLPFVIRTEEVRESKKIMREIGLEPCKDVEFGVMVETPAACWIIEDVCREGISFISFGTNDLTQTTLGIDRDNERIAKLYDEMHPAVLGEIAHVVRTCRKYGVTTSICGQAGSRPDMAKFLVRIGIDSISANIDAVSQIRETVAHTERDLIMELIHDKYRPSTHYGY